MDNFIYYIYKKPYSRYKCPIFEKTNKQRDYMAYGVAHPTAYAVVCLEIKKYIVFILMFAGFEITICILYNSANFIIKIHIRNISQQHISFFLFLGKVWSDSDIPSGSRAQHIHK